MSRSRTANLPILERCPQRQCDPPASSSSMSSRTVRAKPSKRPPFDLAALLADAGSAVAVGQPRGGRAPSTSVAQRSAAQPPPGWSSRPPSPEKPSKPSCKVAEIWARARRNLESKFTVAWAKQLAAMALCDTAGRPDVKKAVLLKAHAERMTRQANKALAAVVRRENADAVACDGVAFAVQAVEAVVRVEEGLEASEADRRLCEQVLAVAGQGAIDPTRDPAQAPAAEALALGPAPEQSGAVPAPTAAALEQQRPTPRLALGSASPASDDAEEAVGLGPPGGAATTQPAGRRRRSRKRQGKRASPRVRKRRHEAAEAERAAAEAQLA